MIKDRLIELDSRINAVNDDGRKVVKVIVTKFRTPQEVNTVIDCGIDNIAENRVQALLQKLPDIKPAKIHLIGHLQSNKAKEAVRVADLIQSADSEHILYEINKQAASLKKVQQVLIQVNIAHEETKFGISKEDLKPLMDFAAGLEFVKVKGLMSIMPKEKKTVYYQDMHDLYENAKIIKPNGVDMDILSMGMSNDFEDAVANGSTMVRVGTFVFT